MQRDELSIGIDVGSTTVKLVILDSDRNVLYSHYVRHSSKVKEVVLEELNIIKDKFGLNSYHISFTGSAGLGLSTRSKLPFVQEVESSYYAIKKFYPSCDAAIELGGEDAKIIFITGGVEQRMNSSCAGGTGAFIDQMATLLNVSLSELDELSSKAEKAYPIASRCGVFAKTDIQSILNQGAKKEDIALSIFYAVAEQTIAGLCQGRELKGNILFLGGPLYFFSGLRYAFKDRLHLRDEEAFYPSDASTFIAKGAALFALDNDPKLYKLENIIKSIEKSNAINTVKFSDPLFRSEEEYQDFLKRHQDFDVKYKDIATYEGNAYLGIDEGSTTTKVILLSEDSSVLYQHYEYNNGLPIDKIVAQLKHIYEIANPKMKIISSAVTGYGEDLIRAALKVDFGLVETIAHYKAASFFAPNVDFILDIGGQDIKCFHIKNHAIDSIMLNEACSSGCGSFLQTFAEALNYDVETYSNLALYAPHPVELGSRCTVFMNSSIKEAQRDGASVEDIAAGLCRSIVKNALYKVIRVHSFDELGKTIVCQGGTFLNNAVLRSFEQEIQQEVIRPSIAGLMGAFGAALYAKENARNVDTHLLHKDELNDFTYDTKHSVCKGCSNHCNLTIMSFKNKTTFISGNKCEKGAGGRPKDDKLDIYAYKRKRLEEISLTSKNGDIKVGLPLSLLMYEQLPLWKTFFEKLNFKVIVSKESTRKLYRAGQKTIPSDTACYPAKLMHGHIDYLIKEGVDFIFYPSESYNIDEHRGVNHFNCPVVAYYGELIKKNDERLNDNNFLDPFVNINTKKKAVDILYQTFKKYKISKKDIKKAFESGLKSLNDYKIDLVNYGQHIIFHARENNKKIILLAGRPYHVDKEINHGIDKLLDSLDVAVISEDSIPFKFDPLKVKVLNQWTYHARLFDAANFVSENDDINLIQLVSFGCGVDAITSDEVRRILESHDKLYTQLKIDEISNLGAIKIRIRSLLNAQEEREKR